MQKNLRIKAAAIVLVLLVFLYGILGIPKGLSGQALLASLLDRIHLGLDLKGGMHLILQVMVDDAINIESDRAIERLKEDLQPKGVNFAEISQPDTVKAPGKIEIKGVAPDKVGVLRQVVSDKLPEYELSSGPEGRLVLTMKPSAINDLKIRTVQQSIETISQRVNALGVTEPTIQEHGLGENEILVELPGIDDLARVENILQSTAMLEIRQAFTGPFPDEAAALASTNGVIPPNQVMLHGNTGRAAQEEVYLVSRSAAVAGQDIRDARPTQDENGRPAVTFFLTGKGGQRFGAFTGAHVGDKLAVVLDNKVREVATIEEQIRDTGRITGGFDEASSKDLSMMLRSGALPASIHILGENTVGPTLGKQSIKEGITSAIAGMLAVMVFMLVYYRGAGVNADLALVLNLVILLGFLGFSGATLTLPGIAGVILTIGMGVDSNVLIFERIREEIRAGKSPSMAIDQGFGRAWVTIIDTHVTTIVSAAILFVFGTGPVRGFATTLVFGLLANLFTAVFVSRVIFEAGLLRKERGEAISI